MLSTKLNIRHVSAVSECKLWYWFSASRGRYIPLYVKFIFFPPAWVLHSVANSKTGEKCGSNAGSFKKIKLEGPYPLDSVIICKTSPHELWRRSDEGENSGVGVRNLGVNKMQIQSWPRTLRQIGRAPCTLHNSYFKLWVQPDSCSTEQHQELPRAQHWTLQNDSSCTAGQHVICSGEKLCSEVHRWTNCADLSRFDSRRPESNSSRGSLGVLHVFARCHIQHMCCHIQHKGYDLQQCWINPKIVNLKTCVVFFDIYAVTLKTRAQYIQRKDLLRWKFIFVCVESRARDLLSQFKKI